MKTRGEANSLDPAELSEQILDRLVSICGTEEVRMNPDLAIYERQVLDSMKTVEFIVAVEHDLGIYISPAELDRETWATPRKIVADIQRRLKS